MNLEILIISHISKFITALQMYHVRPVVHVSVIIQRMRRMFTTKSVEAVEMTSSLKFFLGSLFYLLWAGGRRTFMSTNVSLCRVIQS